MNKQELIKKIQDADIQVNDNSHNYGLRAALSLISHLDEPKLPEPIGVPKMLADWYSKNKDHIESAIYIMHMNIHDSNPLSPLQEYFNNSDNRPIETVIKMGLYGYFVYEPNFTVKLNGKAYLMLNNYDDYSSFSFVDNSWSASLLTEKEIKTIDPRYWAFAEKVQ